MTNTLETNPGQLPAFEAPYDWSSIDQTVRSTGGVIVKGFLDSKIQSAINTDIDSYLAAHSGAGRPGSGSDVYNDFLGRNTIRLHGLIAKVPSTAHLIGNGDIVGWAERLLGDVTGSVLLNAGELIQIQPSEPAQFPHRDSDSWPEAPVGEHPWLSTP